MSPVAKAVLTVNVARMFHAGAGTEFRFEFKTDAALLDVAEAAGDLSGSARIMRGDGEIVAIGTLGLNLSVPCRRCLEPVADHGDIDFEGRYVQASSPEANPNSPSYDPEVFTLDEGGVLDLTDLVRQSVISAASPSTLCKPDCAGLCPVCGNNLNERDCGCKEYDVDPRWAPLKELMAKMLAHADQDESGNP